MGVKQQQGLVLVAGSGIIVSGNFDVTDVATKTTPVPIPGTDTLTQLTNDAQGAQTTNANAPPGITELWDPVNDEFDFSQLKMGDQVFIRAVITIITSTTNTDIDLELIAGIGVGAFSVNWHRDSFKSMGSFKVAQTSFVTMDTVAILTGKAQFQLSADKACDVEIGGWDYIVNLRS
jgi:hypothetical protein